MRRSPRFPWTVSGPAACPLLVLGLAMTSCATSVTWREADLGPVPFDDAWVGLMEISAADGYPEDAAHTDRGLKVFTSRWRRRQLSFGRTSRQRVHGEFQRGADGVSWLLRYHVERQQVTNLSRSFDPDESDWEASGQDDETERRFAAKLRRRFPPGGEDEDAADRL